MIVLYQSMSQTLANATTPYMQMGDIGIAISSPDGTVKSGFTIPWWTKRYGTIWDPVFIYDDLPRGRKRPANYESAAEGFSWYYDMHLINGANANYLLVNVTKRNYEKEEMDRIDQMKDTSMGNGVLYTITKEGISKKYLFRVPDSKEGGLYGNFASADYNPKTKMYCTVIGNRNAHTQQVVWFKLE